MKLEREGDGVVQTLKITVTKPEFQEVYRDVLKHLRKHAKIKGFKPGAAPLKLVENYYGRQRVTTEALQEAINTYYSRALDKEGLEVVKVHEVKVESFNPDEPDALSYTVKVEVKPKVELPPLSEMVVRLPDKEITEDDVEEQIEMLRESAATYEEVNEPVDDGYRVKLSYEMRSGDEVVAGNVDEEHLVDVDEESLLPAIYENIIGMKPEEEKTFKVSFPEDYHIKELAGKEVEVTLRVKSVMKKVLPEIDDEFAKRFEAESLEQLRKQIEDSLKQARDYLNKQSALNQVFNHLMEELDIPLPPSLVQARYSELMEGLKRSVGSLEEYLKERGITEEQLKDELMRRAERDVKGTLIMEALMRELDVRLDPHTLQHLMETSSNLKLKFFQYIQAGYSPEAAFNELYQNIVNEMLAEKLWNLVTKEYYKEGVEGVAEALSESLSDSEGPEDSGEPESEGLESKEEQTVEQKE